MGGLISNFDLLGALQRFPAVADLLLPGVDRWSILRDEKSFDAANTLWDGMSGGRRRVNYTDFAAYVQKPKAAKAPRRKVSKVGRSSKTLQKQGSQNGEEQDDSKLVPDMTAT